ncbi:hypothetical protein FGIG_08687 [Fasciola gigantica]|uniref:Uncharacterized protein n=1 Tax=Fasciola gigantica TaxID=46835 RepID=A0A504YHI4_FASGI|nr:hypothetical protein FGIG_08687 [Fasciola gigantica]
MKPQQLKLGAASTTASAGLPPGRPVQSAGSGVTETWAHKGISDMDPDVQDTDILKTDSAYGVGRGYRKVPNIRSPTQTTQPQHEDTVPELNEAPTGLNTEAYGGLIQCGSSVLGLTSKNVPEAMRTKKQGVPGEGQNQLCTSGLIHHFKDIVKKSNARSSRKQGFSLPLGQGPN